MNLEFRKSLRRKKGSAVAPPSVERDLNAEINLKGWLYRLEGSPLKHWKKRWCVLAQYALFVYKDEDEHKLLASLLLPGYNVRVCTSHDKVSHKNAFVAEHHAMKSYYFAADSNAAMCQWRNSMAQAATVQIPPTEKPIAAPSQAVYERDYGRYLHSMNVTRSPIYANAPPKPKRLSPPANRPRSADFLNAANERREIRPHTSMRLLDPDCEAFPPKRPLGLPPTAHHHRPKSCLAEPMVAPVERAPHRRQEAHELYKAPSSPAIEHDMYGSIRQEGSMSRYIINAPSANVLSAPSGHSTRSSLRSYNFHNSADCYNPPQADLSSMAHSMNSLHRAMQPPTGVSLSRSVNDILRDEHLRFRSAQDSQLSEHAYRKPPSGRTASPASYGSICDEIQPSKLEIFRRVPQPSYTSRPPPPHHHLNGTAKGPFNAPLYQASRELQSLQSLTDSQYSTGLPESSLPSLESNSSDLHTPSPIQNFTNLPPAQLRLPPKYSEACLRSAELVQQKLSSAVPQPPQAQSVSPPKKDSPHSERSSTPTTNNSRKLLFDSHVTLSPVKTPLVEKTLEDDPYGREYLLKASQMLYLNNNNNNNNSNTNSANSNMNSVNNNVTAMNSNNYAMTNGSSRTSGQENRNSLDVSFQSSSHNSVFEHETRPLSTVTSSGFLSQMDKANYAILKQEIEGPKVIETDTGNTARVRNGRISTTESVSSNGSHGSVIKGASPPSPPRGTAEDEPPKGSVSQKLAFFEAKVSPEPSNQLSPQKATVPDLIDELRGEQRSRAAVISTASSEDILKVITDTTKHQRSLSLLEGPAPDVVPLQSPPYYYSDLSLSATEPTSERRDAEAATKPPSGQQSRQHGSTSSSSSRRSDARPSHRRAQHRMVDGKQQSWSCENLLKKQSLKVPPEATQSATCLLESEPFYENIGFGCKGSAVRGPEPQSSPAKISFLANSSAQDSKTASVEKSQQSTSPPTSSQSSQESLSRSEAIRQFCGLVEPPAASSPPGGPPLVEGAPDLIQSALNSSADANDEIFAQIINSISCPSKIDIPERYISESDSDADFSVVERLARCHKADSIRRRLAGHSRDQASRLSMNRVIAKQAKHMSKIVAAQQ